MTRRVLVAGLTTLVALATAIGPSRLADATGLLPAATAPGFLPEPLPVRVTAPTLRIALLRSVLDNQPIPLAGGGQSPRQAVLLEFAGIELDQLRIAQDTAGFALAITNDGTGSAAATIGGAGQIVQLWGVLKRLEVCLAALPGPEACPDVADGIGALSLLIRSGGKLPDELRGRNLDLELYALKVANPRGTTSLSLPRGRLVVDPR